MALASGGIPLIYLGDEVATLNDHTWQRDAHKAVDSRWLHRPPRDAARYGSGTHRWSCRCSSTAFRQQIRFEGRDSMKQGVGHAQVLIQKGNK